MIQKVLTKVFGSKNERVLKQLKPLSSESALPRMNRLTPFSLRPLR